MNASSPPLIANSSPLPSYAKLLVSVVLTGSGMIPEPLNALVKVSVAAPVNSMGTKAIHLGNTLTIVLISMVIVPDAT